MKKRYLIIIVVQAVLLMMMFVYGFIQKLEADKKDMEKKFLYQMRTIEEETKRLENEKKSRKFIGSLLVE